MQPEGHHLAQVNDGRLVAPTDDRRVGDFMAALDRVNGLGKRMPGFVWMLEGSGEPGVGNTVHWHFYKRRAEWFEVPGETHLGMWWVPVGHRPTLGEALERLRREGVGDAAFDGQISMVRIGSQDDAEFLAAVVREMGGVDIVLDDGSHQMVHIRESLRVLFPLISVGGVYFIEDLHTAYWEISGGGVTAKTNFFGDVRRFIDDMHKPCHSGMIGVPEFGGMLSGTHVQDSIVVPDKARTYPPHLPEII